SSHRSDWRVDPDHVDAIGAAANLEPAEIAHGKGRRGTKTLHRGTRGEKAAIDLAAELSEPRRRIHHIAVEHDRALDVADLADDHRTKMQAAANPRCST